MATRSTFTAPLPLPPAGSVMRILGVPDASNFSSTDLLVWLGLPSGFTVKMTGLFVGIPFRRKRPCASLNSIAALCPGRCSCVAAAIQCGGAERSVSARRNG